MSNYKIAKVPFPLQKLKEMVDSYEKSGNTPGGFAVRYRMPKEMVAMLNKEVGAGADKSYGMGLGECKRVPFLLQPRQMEGIQNAKDKGKAYNLVLSKKQLQAMNGQGIFSSILKSVAGPLAEAAVGAITKAVKGKGEDTPEPEEADAEGRDDDSGAGCADCGEICTACMGSGFLPLLALPLLKEALQPRQPRMPRKPGPMPPRGPPPKNAGRAPMISM